ncbi:MAG: GGDEF domain-containing protein [bacterium]|nr:GGDEF domain-containing protein [Gammaproteobacteria bacterium]
MQKSRNYLMLAAAALICFGAIMALSPGLEMLHSVTVAIGMIVLTMVAGFILSITIRQHSDELAKNQRGTEKTLKELSMLKARYNEITTLDDLTGSSNRRHFIELLTQHRAMSERGLYKFTVVVTQVDQFAEIVEREGLARGNEILRLFAHTVKVALREVDVFARLNNDKFGMVLSGCSEKNALILINRVSQLISQIPVNDKHDMAITASGGVTSFHGTETPEDLVQHAEQALQQSVQQGKDRVTGYDYVEPGDAGANS